MRPVALMTTPSRHPLLKVGLGAGRRVNLAVTHLALSRKQ